MSPKKTKKPVAKKKASPSSLKRVPATAKMKKHAVKKPLTAKQRSANFVAQLVIAGSAIAVLLLLGVIDHVTFRTALGGAQGGLPVTVGVEHDGPLTLDVLFARKEHAGYASITNASDETIFISTPSSWTRAEVTGAAIADVKQAIPVFGFTRSTLPGHAGIKFMLPDEAPDSVYFDSPAKTSTTAAINLQMIDLATLNATSRVVLLKDHALVQLWGASE
jgi:hypothetical protein